jgi:hypothetical protein
MIKDIYFDAVRGKNYKYKHWIIEIGWKRQRRLFKIKLNVTNEKILDYNLIPKTYVNDDLNLKIGCEFIIVRQINDYLILIFYKSAILDDSEILDIIKWSLLLW